MNWKAAVTSAIIPGLGQLVFKGQWLRTIGIWVGFVLLYLPYVFATFVLGATAGFGGTPPLWVTIIHYLPLTLYVVQIIDAGDFIW